MTKITPHIPVNQGTSQENQSEGSKLNALPKLSLLKQGLKIFRHTKTGLYHDDNEDSSLFDQEVGFYAVADGVGGGARGDVASSTLLDFLLEKTIEYYEQDYDVLFDYYIIDIIKQSDNAVKEALTALGNARGASTLVSAWLKPLDSGGYKAHYTNVGDARIYLLNKGDNKITVNQLTTDQTYENMGLMHKLPDRGSPDDPIRMIGVGAVGNPEVQHIDINANQGLLFCSDGLHKFVDDSTIETICTEFLCTPKDQNINVDAICHALVEKAIENNSHDDVTALIVWLNSDDSTTLKSNETNNGDASIRSPSLISPLPQSTAPKSSSKLFKSAPMLLVLVAVGLVFGGLYTFKSIPDTDQINGKNAIENQVTNDEKISDNQLTPIFEKIDIPSGYDDAYITHNSNDSLIAVSKNDKWGLINRDGDIVIPLIYDFITPFNDGMAYIRNGDHEFFIDKRNIAIATVPNHTYPIKIKTDEITSIQNEHTNLYQFMNSQSQKLVSEVNYSEIRPLKDYKKGDSDYLIAVKPFNGTDVTKDAKWGYIDSSGNMAIESQFDDAYWFVEDKAVVQKDGEKFYIDKKGNKIP